jgi:uncharacterized protein YndB with AHSA1/START domain
MRNTAPVAPPAAREIVLTRAFDAPRRLVFAALTKPEFLSRWFAPPGWSLLTCEVDLRVGGAWQMMLRSPEGIDTRGRGVYREVVFPERLVYTERFDGFPSEALRTTVLVEDGGKTTLTTTIRCPHPPALFRQNEFASESPFHQRVARNPHSAMPPSTRWACPVM